MNELREIYIGDLIELNIETDLVSEEDILTAFDEFDMVQIKRLDVGYHVTLMTMTPQTYEVEIGGNSIEIEVNSTLESIERQDIFEAITPETQMNSLGPLWVVFGISLGLCLMSGVWFIIKALRRPKVKVLTQFEQLSNAIEEVDPNSPSYLGDITGFFKGYLSQVAHKPLEGLTSEEVVLELALEQKLSSFTGEIKDWLDACDQLKYRKPTDRTEQGTKVHMKETLMMLVARIEEVIKVQMSEKEVVQ